MDLPRTVTVYNTLPSSYPLPIYKEEQFGIKTDDVVGFTDEQRLADEMQFTLSVTNESKWLYKNYKYPRYTNFYGYAQLMSGVYVVRNIELLHINQELLYWQDSRVYLTQEIHCAKEALVKYIVAQSDKAPQELEDVQSFLVPIRQRFTSIRFRLCPGVQANVALRWSPLQARCSNIFDPPDKQADPHPQNNKDGAPSDRPSDQPQDPKDRSNNDDKDDPNDDRPKEPKPGTKTGGVGGKWKVALSGFDANDIGYNVVYPTDITDPSAEPTATFIPTGIGNSASGKVDKRLLINGNNTDATGFDLSSTSVFYE